MKTIQIGGRDGNYVLAANSIAQNITAIDKQVGVISTKAEKKP